MVNTRSESVSQILKTPKRIAFIPARGGSKSIPKKNLASIHGISLLEYAIGAAKSSGLFSQIVVSSDSSEILATAERFGCQLHVRPDELSRDNSRVIDAVIHAFTDMSIKEVAQVCVLQPTSPMRRAHHIRQDLPTKWCDLSPHF